MNYKEISSKILDCVGKDNIVSYTHCATRLRFVVVDKTKIKEDELKSMTEIMRVIDSNGQYQLVIGPDVEKLYDAIAKVLPPEKATAVLDVNEDAAKKNGEKGINKIFKSIVNCIAPVLGVMVATGLVKGILSLLAYFAVIDTTGGTYLVLNALSDALFYFFPIIVGYNCGKEFGCDPIMTAVVGGTLVYPSIVATFNEGISLTFLGIPLVLKNYTASLLPVIAGGFVASKIEKLMKKITPVSLKLLIVPFVTLAISVPLTFLIVGPAITWIANLICEAVLIVWDFAPALASGLIGAFWQLLVMTGMHYGMTPVVVGISMTYGYDPMGPCICASMLALAGASVALFVRTKKTQEKPMSLTAMFSALMGITEPALYTVGLVYRKLLYGAILGGGLAGIVSGVLGARTFGFGPNPLTQFALTFSEEGFKYTIMWCAVQIIAFAVSFVIGYLLLGKDKKEKA